MKLHIIFFWQYALYPKYIFLQESRQGINIFITTIKSGHHTYLTSFAVKICIKRENKFEYSQISKPLSSLVSMLALPFL